MIERTEKAALCFVLTTSSVYMRVIPSCNLIILEREEHKKRERERERERERDE